jgi:hypothetical protein
VLTLYFDTIQGNDALCNITNGSGNGNNDSDTNTGDNNGNLNGNGVTGNVAVAGGGIYNNNQATIFVDSVNSNFALCSVTNGTNNGGGDAVHTDSADGDTNGDAVVGNITVSTGNMVSCGISNGNNNGDGDGDFNTGTNEGKNNGNGVVGFVEVSGGGLDNESSGHVRLFGTMVSANSASGSVGNGSNNGNNDGNNNGGADDGNGCGLDSDLTLHGGGIRNAGTLLAYNTTFFDNSVTSFIQNGSGNGNNCGNNENHNAEGRSNGDGVTGDVLIAGGAIANAASLDVLGGSLTYNSLSSTVINGSNNGNNDGTNDVGFTNCGDNCGNAIGEGANTPADQIDLEIDGGAIGNGGAGDVLLLGATITNNGIFSTVSTGTGNGQGDGASQSTNTGLGDGNGVHGNIEVVGGGTANFGTMTILFCDISGNSILSNVPNGSGSGTTASDGQLVSGSVAVTGNDTF